MMAGRYSVPLMHSTSTPVYWVIFKSTFLPLKIFFPLQSIKHVIPDIILLSESCLILFSHSSLTSSFHCFRSEVILYSYLLSTSVLFSPSLLLFDSTYPFMSFSLLCFFKLPLLMFLGVPLSFFLSTLSVANRWRISVCVPPLLF